MIRPLAALLLAGASATAEPAPLTDADFAPADPALAALGRLLFWDPILSGNRNISCGTCHHPRFATGDGLSLGLGEGGVGLGPERTGRAENAPERLIPRNAPPLFNMGARQMTVLFADGRVEVDPARPGGLRTPMGAEMTEGFASLLSAQTMFPVLSADEMAGHLGENDVARAVRMGRITGPGGAWDVIAGRVRAVPAYAEGFAALGVEHVAFTDVSDAVAAFVAAEWRADDTAYDRALRGGTPLPPDAARGQSLFFGAAGCAACHAGPLLSDMGFHATGQPQLGPGKAARFERHVRDTGRQRVTGDAADAYAFRTPPLRNVVHTGPWGHAGAFSDLRAFLRRHPGGPAAGHAAVLPAFEAGDVWAAMDDPAEAAAIAAAARPGPALGAAELDDLLAFLGALTDETALGGRTGIPEAVPSGLPVDR